MKASSMIRRLAAVALFAVATGTAYAQPKMEIVGGDTYDWGTVGPGKLTTVVQVKNIGTEELKILDVHSGSSLVMAQIDKNLLAPGDIGKISITLDISFRYPVTTVVRVGAMEKLVNITSDDPADPVRVLHLKANLRYSLTFEPQFMLVTDATVGVESPASPIKIINTDTIPITIMRPEIVPGGNIKVRFDMRDKVTLKPGEQLRWLRQVFVTPMEATSLHGTIRIRTSSLVMPMIDVPIYGTMATNSPAAGTGR